MKKNFYLVILFCSLFTLSSCTKEDNCYEHTINDFDVCINLFEQNQNQKSIYINILAYSNEPNSSWNIEDFEVMYLKILTSNNQKIILNNNYSFGGIIREGYDDYYGYGIYKILSITSNPSSINWPESYGVPLNIELKINIKINGRWYKISQFILLPQTPNPLLLG